MKSLFSILPVSIAVLLLTLFPMVPHHHFRGGVNIVMEWGKGAKGPDEQHPVSGLPAEQPVHEGECIVNARYVLPSQVLHVVYGTENGSDLHHAAGFTVPSAPVSFTPVWIMSGTICSAYNSLYTSARSGLCSGLRAPPDSAA